METTVTLYSKVFMEEDCSTWSARPSERIMEMLHSRQEGTARWIAVIGGVHVALGDPVAGWVKKMYVPHWILESCQLEGTGEEVEIRFERCESFLKAEKLGFQVLGDIPADIDLKDLLEEPLSQLGVIHKGQMIPAPAFEGVHLLLRTCEPDGPPVFLDGAEVSLEIEQNTLSTPSPPFTPVTPDPVAAAPPLPLLPLQQEQVFSDILPASMMLPVRSSGPFQGVGRRLCD
jgi:hypothetical protein